MSSHLLYSTSFSLKVTLTEGWDGEEVGWGGRWEGGSGWGTRVHPWQIHVDVWQNQYNIVK